MGYSYCVNAFIRKSFLQQLNLQISDITKLQLFQNLVLFVNSDLFEESGLHSFILLSQTGNTFLVKYMTSGHARKKKACKVHKMHYRSTVNLYICRISLTLLSIFSKLHTFLLPPHCVLCLHSTQQRIQKYVQQHLKKCGQ